MECCRNDSLSLKLDRGVTDLMKFLSCLMIAFHHYSQDRVIAGTDNIVYQLFSTQGGWLGVAIFFFLSGYGLMKSELKSHMELVPFFKKRLVKTYFPAVLVSVVWEVYLVASGLENLDFHVVTGALWKFNDGVLWFVRAIICLYVAFCIYVWVRNKLNRRRECAGVLLLIAALSTSFLYFVRIVPYPVHASSVMLFFLGVELAERPDMFVKVIRLKYPVVLAFIALIVCAAVCRYNADVVHGVIDYLVIMSGVVFFSLYDVKILKLPAWMGSASYDMYLVHNKAKMLLVANMKFVPLWAFAGLAAVFTIVFYHFREMVEKILSCFAVTIARTKDN